MGVGAGLYMYDVVVKSSRSLSHLLMSSCNNVGAAILTSLKVYALPVHKAHTGGM